MNKETTTLDEQKTFDYDKDGGLPINHLQCGGKGEVSISMMKRIFEKKKGEAFDDVYLVGCKGCGDPFLHVSKYCVYNPDKCCHNKN